jgi:hypothetical protein
MNNLINTGIRNWANLQEKDSRVIINKIKNPISQFEIDKLYQSIAYLNKVVEIGI